MYRKIVTVVLALQCVTSLNTITVMPPMVQLLKNPHAGMAFAYGLTTKYLAKKMGFLIANTAKHYEREAACALNGMSADECKRSYTNLDLVYGIIGIDTAVFLWTNAYYAARGYYTAKFPAQLPGFDAAHQSGMDTLHVLETLGDVHVAATKILNDPTQKSNDKNNPTLFGMSKDLMPLTISFAAGLLNCYLAFKVGEKLAAKITSDRILFTTILYDIGIVGSYYLKKLSTQFGQSFEVIKNCHACNEVYTVGEDLAYVFEGVLPNYAKLAQQLKVKQD